VIVVAWDEPQRIRKPKKTTRRYQILQFIIDYADSHDGPTPSVLEIQRCFNRPEDGKRLHYSTIREYIKDLIVDGRIRYEDGKLIVIGSDWLPPDDYISDV
jgi:hypothetical protein